MSVLSWSSAMVSNAGDFETAAIRNYWEHRLVREALSFAVARYPVRVAHELGAGYGRMARVLAEFAETVVAFERDASLVSRGRTLNPDINFIPIQHLGRIPAADGTADFALTFTVLQHLTDASYRAALDELKRLVRLGHVLLVEDTDDSQPDRDLPHDETAMCRHRGVARYETDMAPWRLVKTWPRKIEPGHPRSVAGTAMLFTSG